MVERKRGKLKPEVRPTGGPGKSRQYDWKVTDEGGKVLDSGTTNTGSSGAHAAANEAIERIQDNYEKTGKLKTPFKAGSFLGVPRKK